MNDIVVVGQMYMALSNCRSNGYGLRLRYRLEVFGYASDDLCASSAVPLLAVSRRRSVAVQPVAAERSSTVDRLAVAVVFRYEQCKNAGGLAVVLSLSALLTSLQTWKR